MISWLCVFFDKSKYEVAKTHPKKCDFNSLSDCPYEHIKECNMDKSNCHLKKNDKKKDKKNTKSLWFWLVLALLVYFILTVVSENKNIVFEYHDIIFNISLSIVLSIISALIVSMIIDIPSRLKEYEASFISALTSNLYIKRLDETKLTNLRKEITSQLHKKNVPRMAKGLIDMDEDMMNFLKEPYYTRYRHTITCSDSDEVGYVKKDHVVEYKMINPYGANGKKTVPIGFNTLLMINEKEKEKYEGKLNVNIICSIDNNLEENYSDRIKFDISKLENIEFYNSKIVLVDKSTDKPGLNIDFNDNLIVKMYYTLYISADDKCFSERLRYPAKNYRVDYSYLNNSNIKLHGQIFGTGIKQSDISVKHINDSTISLETFNWLLPENGVVVVS